MFAEVIDETSSSGIFVGIYRRCPHSMRSRVCNGRVSVRLSVCPIDRQRQRLVAWFAAELPADNRSIAAEVGAAYQLSIDISCRRHGRSVANRERKCADTIGTVLVPWAGHFQC